MITYSYVTCILASAFDLGDHKHTGYKLTDKNMCKNIDEAAMYQN